MTKLDSVKAVDDRLQQGNRHAGLAIALTAVIVFVGLGCNPFRAEGEQPGGVMPPKDPAIDVATDVPPQEDSVRSQILELEGRLDYARKAKEELASSVDSIQKVIDGLEGSIDTAQNVQIPKLLEEYKRWEVLFTDPTASPAERSEATTSARLCREALDYVNLAVGVAKFRLKDAEDRLESIESQINERVTYIEGIEAQLQLLRDVLKTVTEPLPTVPEQVTE